MIISLHHHLLNDNAIYGVRYSNHIIIIIMSCIAINQMNAVSSLQSLAELSYADSRAIWPMCQREVTFRLVNL